MANDNPRFEDLIEFPTLMVLRVVARPGPTLVSQLEGTVLDQLGRSAEAVDLQASSKGNWVSARVRVTVVSADEVRGLYTSLHAVPGVRMVL